MTGSSLTTETETEIVIPLETPDKNHVEENILADAMIVKKREIAEMAM